MVWKLGLLILGAVFFGCAVVKPFERETLSKKCMQETLRANSIHAEYEDKVSRTKTATGLPGSAGGEGCGCIQ